MVNKEFIVGSGGIIKDFQDRNIPQNSNNFVSVSVVIPTSEFEGLGTYGVCLATSKVVGGVETSLPSLICYRAKTLKIEGVDYIKYQCQLSISYTNYIGQLKLTPYIIEIETLNEGEEDEETVITTQKTFTNTTLNVIKSIASTSDASLEESEAVDTLNALISAKNIKLVEDYKTGTKEQAIVGCFTDYNASSYEGWLLIVKYSGGEIALLPYKNGADNEFTEIDMDSKFYKLSNYSSGSYTTTALNYSKAEVDTILQDYYTKSQLYTKTETDALLDTKVDKTFTISGHALSGASLQLHPIDVELGNVENYGMVNSPSADATHKYVDAGGLWTYLKTNYADKSDYDTTKAKVEELYTSFKGTGDNDNVVNTLYDLIKVFENFPEADNIATILSGLDSRLDTLESLSDALITINQSITILTTDWESNSGDYSSDYPYKTKANTIKNDLLVGAEAFEIVFSVDSDTSLLSTTAILDDETGNITLYASETPSEDIVIIKINAVNGLNAINTMTTDAILQVEQNKNDISDIKSHYVKRVVEYTDGENNTYSTQFYRSNKYLNMYVSKNNVSRYIIQADGDNGISIKYQNRPVQWEDGAKIELETYKIDMTANKVRVNGKSISTERLFKTTTDATEDGGVYTKNITFLEGIQVNDYLLYVNSGVATTLYQVASISGSVATLNVVASFGGGDSQLYHHYIAYRDVGNNILLNFNFTTSQAIGTIADLKTYLTGIGATSTSTAMKLNGGMYNGYYAYLLYLDNTTLKLGYCTNGGYSIVWGNVSNSAEIEYKAL